MEVETCSYLPTRLRVLLDKSALNSNFDFDGEFNLASTYEFDFIQIRRPDTDSSHTNLTQTTLAVK
jgi:hypothetical protein